MTIDPQKYVVFKRGEFQDWLNKWYPNESALDAVKKLELPDAVVLRLRDIHAAGALYSYASSLLATFEILSQNTNENNLSKKMRQTMHDIWEMHEYFITLAEESRRTSDKIPTP